VTTWLRRNWHRILVHSAGLATLAWLAAVYLFALAPLPERYIMLQSGTLGLIFLVASLACTPLRRWLFPRAVQVRRALGLYAFAFICIHVVAYAVAENSLDLELIVRDLDERRAMLIGFAGFVLLIPLAITSTAGWQRRLGRRWRTLHRLVYVAAVLSVWHYLWLDRDIITTPLIFAGLVGGLLVLRLVPRS
jgi:methionine sulfoxide reductase heme-binding subunit